MALNEFFLLIFKFLCITAAGFMIGYWILIFYTNKDLTLIDYKAIEDVKDLIYPQPSICFVTPFINNQLLNVSDNERYNHPYLRFLEGDGNYELYKSINYSQVTPNLGNYFKWLMFFWKPGKSQIKTYCSNIRECPYLKFKNHYNGFWSTYFMKCFSIEIDSEYIRDIRQFYVAFNSEFRNVLNQVLQTVVFFFHPNQFLRPREEPKFIWRKEDNFSNSEMFQITSLELLKRRNKHNGKCLSDWNEYDDLVLKLFLKSVSCKPPYIKENSTNLCETEDSFQKARYNGWNFAKKNAILYPCQEMSLISYKHDFYPNGDETRDLHLFSVSYPPTIKIIKQSQAVDVHSLIGNIGGYIGLFLGKFSIKEQWCMVSKIIQPLAMNNFVFIFLLP